MLRETDVDPDPLVQAAAWWFEAGGPGAQPANEMAVATVDPSGTPSLRMVLLRGLDHRGFVFFTNYLSPKGRAIDRGSSVALMLRWPPFRQIRAVGPATRVPEDESDRYWQSRPRESQISAVASPQSQVMSRQALEAAVARVRADVGEGPVPRPLDWGGYRVVPTEVELWQEQANRLHDRLRYRRTDAVGWQIKRLAP